MASILQDWVMELGLRHQGVLLTAVRGCDTVSKNDPVKLISRCVRYEILRCHCGDAAKSVSFIEQVDDDELGRRMKAVLKDFDHYPQHYLQHLMHAAEIIGYKKPDSRWLWFYEKWCNCLHVNPEGEDQLDARLNADEVAFGKLAQVS